MGSGTDDPPEGLVTRTPQSTRSTAPYEIDGTLPAGVVASCPRCSDIATGPCGCKEAARICKSCGEEILQGEVYVDFDGGTFCCHDGCTVPTGGVEPAKHDQGKPRYDLIPPEGIEAIARVLTYGADKYGDRNWEGGLAWGRVFAACMRHLWAWWWGEDEDRESGLSHLAHAACCVLFLLAYEARGVGEDDRRRRVE